MQKTERVADPLPPAFYPVSLNLVGRKCVVIGAGEDREAIEKNHALREVGADVVWLTDWENVREEDVADAYFVIYTPQVEAPAVRLRAFAEKHKFLYCAIDQPLHGFVAMAAIVKAGPARIAISTGGVSPRVGGKLRAALQSALDTTFARFLDCLGTQKLRNRTSIPDAAARRTTMIKSADGFEIDITLRYPAWFEEELRTLRPTLEP